MADDRMRDQEKDQGLGGRQGESGRQAPGRNPLDDQSKGRSGGQGTNPEHDKQGIKDRGIREGKEGELNR
ncbi:MAG TPA: hypothetical protein VMM84_10075 [Pyrinomonadaceae bacterium]|nr:hypothetical protein [Pyrinomonadaceae bacterium]